MISIYKYKGSKIECGDLNFTASYLTLPPVSILEQLFKCVFLMLHIALFYALIIIFITDSIAVYQQLISQPNLNYLLPK